MIAVIGCSVSPDSSRSGWANPVPETPPPMAPAMSVGPKTPASSVASQWYGQWLHAFGTPARAATDAGVAAPGDHPGSAGAGSAGAPSAPHVPAGGSGGSSGGDTHTPPASPTPPAAGGACVDATQLWFDDFETGDYQRWTSQTYNDSWGDNCQSNAISTESAHSPTHAQRSEIVCPYTADSVQRGYGGVQFSGDSVVPAFTNQGAGIDAPNGVVTVMWMRLSSPTVFQNGTWVNFWTASATCDWSDEVMTLGIEDASGRLAAAHYAANGGTRTFEPNAPALPRDVWTRITVYVNYYDGVMHVWQDGRSLEHVTFSRALHTICQFHWGLYASADNSNIVLFEDDKSVWKLGEAWTDFNKEPYLGQDVQACTK